MMNLVAHFNAARERLKGEDEDEEFSPPLADDDDESSTTTRKRYVFRHTLKQAIRENWLTLFSQ